MIVTIKCLKSIKGIIVTSLLFVCFASLQSAAVTIEEAYAAIPHKRTLFNAQESRLPREQAQALVGIFELVEQALVLKVDGLKAIEAAQLKSLQKVLDRYDSLLMDLNTFSVPNRFEALRTAIATAVQLHRDYFRIKFDNLKITKHVDASFTDEIYESSNHLRQAYQYLMENQPETQKNKIAFYDYLCSLDFI